MPKSAAEQPAKPDDAECDRVVVAVHIRPLIDNELSDGCQECLFVAPGQPQASIDPVSSQYNKSTTTSSQITAGGQCFTYDHVYGGAGKPPAQLYNHCVQPLVDGLFKGYNATVFAYGQTGSGKTYTMGSALGSVSQHGVIPLAMNTLFSRVAASQDATFTVRVGFVEIHQESIRDLLVAEPREGGVHIRELPSGGIVLAGATEQEISSQQEMMALLQQGSHMRATASTEMNQRSSRSHAIFTITLEQRRPGSAPPPPRSHASRPDSTILTSDSDDASDIDDTPDFEEYLCAKLHLVDLAGSERVKRTKAQGQRLREGININKGLLALGNVICALSENKPHVPYRDSKLTRMLQDSLGGNSRTLMVACVSPADVNLEESVNTLRYASRARNIRNKPVVNRDPVAAEIAHLRQQLAASRAEVGALKRRLGEGGVDTDTADAADAADAAVQELQQRVAALELDNARLQVELETAKAETSQAHKHMIEAQAARDLAQGQGMDPQGPPPAVLQQHLQRISALENEVQRLRRLQRISGSIITSQLRTPATPDRRGSPLQDAVTPIAMVAEGVTGAEDQSEDLAAEEQAYRLQQEAVQQQLDTLQRVLEAKEAQMARLTKGGGQVANLRQHYDKALKDMAAERDALQQERKALVQRLHALQHASEEERATLERRYREQLASMDGKLRDLQRRERDHAQLETLKARSEEACKRLQGDIHQIKQQKVALHRQMDRANRDFQEWRRSREREIMQLRAQGRRNAVQIQKLELLHSRQQAVLRRKTEEAEAARRRLKEVQLMREGSGVGTRATQGVEGEVECQPNQHAPLLRDEKARKTWVERELDACCARVLEGEKAQRSDAVRRLKDTEKQLALMRSPAHTPLVLSSPLARTAPASEDDLEHRRAELLERVARHSQQIVELQQQLVRVRADEEARGGGAADARRWNQLRNVVEARTMLKTVFRTASGHKALAAEAATEATEMREECELLRLKLEIAQQERDAARKVAAAAATAAVAIAGGGGAGSPGEGGRPVNRLTTSVDAEVSSLLEAMEQHAGSGRSSKGVVRPLLRTPSGDVLVGSSRSTEPPVSSERVSLERGSNQERVAMWAREQMVPEDDIVVVDKVVVIQKGEQPAVETVVPSPQDTPGLLGEPQEDRQDDKQEDYSTCSSGSSGDEGDAWDPDNPTPAPVRTKSARLQRGEHPFATHALHDLNERRSADGLPPLPRLTKAVLRTVLQGKQVGGQSWRVGSKTKHDMVDDYRQWLEEQGPGVPPLDSHPVAVSESASESRRTTTTTGEEVVIVPLGRLRISGSSDGRPPVPQLRVVRSSPPSPDKSVVHTALQGSPPREKGGPLLRHRSLDRPPSSGMDGLFVESPGSPRLRQGSPNGRPLPPLETSPPPLLTPGSVRARVGMYTRVAGMVGNALRRGRRGRSPAKEAGEGTTPETAYYLEQSLASRARSEALRAKIASRTRSSSLVDEQS